MIVSRTGAVHVGGILFFQPHAQGGVGLELGDYCFFLFLKIENSPTA
jgi:hypothetical protein